MDANSNMIITEEYSFSEFISKPGKMKSEGYTHIQVQKITSKIHPQKFLMRHFHQVEVIQ